MNTNMVEIGNAVRKSYARKFMDATAFLECDWITIRIDVNNVDMIRIHAIRIDGTDQNLIFTKGQIKAMTVNRLRNMLRQILHNGVNFEIYS